MTGQTSGLDLVETDAAPAWPRRRVVHALLVGGAILLLIAAELHTSVIQAFVFSW